MPIVERYDLHGLLSLLAAHGVRGVVVGGMAAVLQGAPIQTEDIDIVHDRSDANLDRLMPALAELDAVYRHQFGRRIAARREILAGRGHNLLQTRLGGLDLLGELAAGLDYDALAPDAISMQLDAGSIAVLPLERVIELKRAAGRPKDWRVLSELESTLDRLRAGGGGSREE